MYKNILIGYDGSEGSKKALEKAIKLAKTFNSEISALWVKGSLPHYPETIDEIDEEEESANVFFQKLKIEIETLSKQENLKIQINTKPGNPAKIIVDYIKKYKTDLVIMGHRGHSNLWGNFLGHVTDKVSENAGCDVLIVR
jgi:nucleotide-binding universal stress UspA family protein